MAVVLVGDGVYMCAGRSSSRFDSGRSRKREADAGGILLRGKVSRLELVNWSELWFDGKDDAKLVKREDGSFAIEKK